MLKGAPGACICFGFLVSSISALIMLAHPSLHPPLDLALHLYSAISHPRSAMSRVYVCACYGSSLCTATTTTPRLAISHHSLLRSTLQSIWILYYQFDKTQAARSFPVLITLPTHSLRDSIGSVACALE